jgi:4,5-DOPA dioxygenase extradiol
MTSVRLPVLFIGHGSPMNAVEDNEFSRGWIQAAQSIPTPKAILCVSAHWETYGVRVTAMPQPRTIHDFMGFPRELSEKEYPTPGSPELASRVCELLKDHEAKADNSWGLDHGTWSVLCRMYPAADIPVIQLSLDRSRKPEQQYQMAAKLLPLRDEGVLILGSGNLVHNLRRMVWEDRAFDWAEEYDAQVRDWIIAGDHDQIIHYEKNGESAALSVNSGEHYLPLLYSLALQQPGEAVAFFNEKVWGGSLSMRCLRIG